MKADWRAMNGHACVIKHRFGKGFLKSTTTVDFVERDMRTVRKTMTLTDEPNQRIEAHLKAEHYSRGSKHTRDLIRRGASRTLPE
ncbi:hypothetical protein [Noviherbaspirillum pedocola]|uniref:Uncharacterized protein n=1 Tax=Noviherbaspirillum pedocola TaxID=2801341 RepID=A0A934W846_9BURK|nr:hypothetical protein [Noviherbaspirillum pedocola]MBK4737140.1 hypothetical protein [Noviherbaspirillum pedocola]